MRIATWNLNHRVGKVRFRPEAAGAAAHSSAPMSWRSPSTSHRTITRLLSGDPSERSNRVLVVSRIPIDEDDIELPRFDRHCL